MSVLDALRQSAAEDAKVLNQLSTAGDLHEIARDVAFSLYVRARAAAEEICEFVQEGGFGRATSGLTDNGMYRVIVTVRMTLHLQAVLGVSGFMLMLARTYSAEYDGWGCPIARATN